MDACQVSYLDTPAARPTARDQRNAACGERDLDDQLDPVDAVGVPDAQRPSDQRADERRDDSDEDCRENAYFLAAGEHQSTEGTDDGANDDADDDACEGQMHGGHLSFLGNDPCRSDSVSQCMPSGMNRQTSTVCVGRASPGAAASDDQTGAGFRQVGVREAAGAKHRNRIQRIHQAGERISRCRAGSAIDILDAGCVVGQAARGA